MIPFLNLQNWNLFHCWNERWWSRSVLWKSVALSRNFIEESTDHKSIYKWTFFEVQEKKKTWGSGRFEQCISCFPFKESSLPMLCWAEDFDLFFGHDFRGQNTGNPWLITSHLKLQCPQKRCFMAHKALLAVVKYSSTLQVTWLCTGSLAACSHLMAGCHQTAWSCDSHL